MPPLNLSGGLADRDDDLFMSFIDTKSYKVVKSVSFKGSDPNALKLHATGCIEQC